MKHKILKYGLALLTLVFSFLGWYSVDQAISVPNSSVWGLPILWFSLVAIFLYLDMLVWHRMLKLQAILVACLMLSLPFAFTFGHLVVIVLAILFSWWALVKIRKDLKLNVKLDVWKSIRTGSTVLIFALSLVISSQYYFSIRNQNQQKLIPQVNIGDMTGGLTSRILAAFSPGFRNIDQQGLTVDQFILNLQSQPEDPSDINTKVDQMISQNNPNLSDAQKKILKDESLKKLSAANDQMTKSQTDLVLTEGRQKLSDIAGRKVTGQEKISDVLSDLVNRKINQFLGSGLGDSSGQSPLPFILTLVLFLTVFPLGTFINTLWIILTQLCFWALVRFEFVKIAKVMVEMEVIE